MCFAPGGRNRSHRKPMTRPKKKGGRPKGKASVTKAAKLQRTATALELRIAGLSEDQIAERLGVAQSTVSEDLATALAERARNARGKADELVQLGVARCE